MKEEQEHPRNDILQEQEILTCTHGRYSQNTEKNNKILKLSLEYWLDSMILQGRVPSWKCLMILLQIDHYIGEMPTEGQRLHFVLSSSVSILCTTMWNYCFLAALNNKQNKTHKKNIYRMLPKANSLDIKKKIKKSRERRRRVPCHRQIR